MPYQYQVITRVQDPAIGGGNLCPAIGRLFLDPQFTGGDALGPHDPVPVTQALGIKVPNFKVGEVVIVNRDGREVNGFCRKADKWDVDYETFDDIEQAIARAIQVTESCP